MIALLVALFLVLAHASATKPSPSPPLVANVADGGWLAPGVALRVQRVAGGRLEIRRGRWRAVDGWRWLPPRPGAYRARAGDRLLRFRVRPLRLVAVGDVFPTGAALRSAHRRGWDYPWSRVGPRLRDADLTVANLEGVVSTGGRPWPGKPLHFRAPLGFLRAASRDAGLDVVSLANNHSLDFGALAMLATRRNVRRAGILPVGAGRNLAAALAPVIVERGGLRIAFLAVDDVVPSGAWTATATGPGAAPADPAVLAQAVRRAQRRADLVVVLAHFGIEYMDAPIGLQRELAEAALQAGAAVVLGSHPHVLQSVERRGRRVVAWSLGNFVFRVTTPASARTGALEVQLGRGGVLSCRLRPARIVAGRPVWTAR